MCGEEGLYWSLPTGGDQELLSIGGCTVRIISMFAGIASSSLHFNFVVLCRGTYPGVDLGGNL